MPYSKAHKAKARERILQSAIRLFTSRGYEQVSIDEVMAEAALTRGGFYAHFPSKAALYAEAITHGVLNSEIAQRIRSSRKPMSLRDIVHGYLSRRHVEQEFSACPLAFLVSDVGVRDKRAREAYTKAFSRLIRAIAERLPESRSSGADEDMGIAIAALMVGGVAVGSALTDPAMIERVLESCRRAALALSK